MADAVVEAGLSQGAERSTFWREGSRIESFKCLDPETRGVVRVDKSPYASDRINELRVGVLSVLKSDVWLSDRLIEIECISSDGPTGEALLRLGYGRYLDDAILKEKLAPLLDHLRVAGIVARARKQRIHVGRDRLVQWNEVRGKWLPQLISTDGFSQSNLHVNRHMQRWVAEQATESAGFGGDLLELCCGNGNFTLPLASSFPRVIATEPYMHSFRRARVCAEWAGVDNVTFARMKAEEVGEAFSEGGRRFRRLHDAGVDVADYNFGVVFANPPRAGLAKPARKLLANSPRCIYVSCSPRTLARDLAMLPDHEVVASALFDQFPYTRHAEVGVCLQRRRT